MHETKTIDVNRRLQTAAKGELWVSLNEAADYLDQSVLQLGQAWLKLHEWRTRKPNETAALLERRQADLQHIEARFLNQKKLLVSKIQMNLDELTGLFTQPKT